MARDSDGTLESVRATRRRANDTGPIPPVADPARRAAAEASLQTFIETYFRSTLKFPFAPFHLQLIEHVEYAVRNGGKQAVALQRGGLKTSILRWGALWAVLTGRRRGMVLLGATDQIARRQLLEPIKRYMDSNPLLLADFPEVCFPIKKLDFSPRRAEGQHIQGEPTHLQVLVDRVILPTVKGSKASGSFIAVAGITGAVRGLNYENHNGENIRPDIVLADDIQTRESAASEQQCNDRIDVLEGDVAELAGPDTTMAVLAALTVVYCGDAAERLTDRAQFPDYNGIRLRAVDPLPLRMKPTEDGGPSWEGFREALKESLREGRRDEGGFAYYAEHGEALREGAVVAWPHRVKKGHPDALYSLMRVWAMAPDTFFAEYQQEPIPPIADTGSPYTAEHLQTKCLGFRRGQAPDKCVATVAFIDVRAAGLEWMACGFRADFSGHVMDYGIFPEGNHIGPGYDPKALRRPLNKQFPGKSGEEAVYAGLEALVGRLMAMEWRTTDNAPAYLDRLHIDANWGPLTDTVLRFCNASPHRAKITPSFGQPSGQTPISRWRRGAGETIGEEWILKRSDKSPLCRIVQFDANHWKSVASSRLGCEKGDNGSVGFFGDDPAAHAQLFSQLCAEYRIPATLGGRAFEQWKLKPGADNHWLDCFAGCCVAASITGQVSADRAPKATKAKPKEVSWAQRQANANGARPPS